MKVIRGSLLGTYLVSLLVVGCTLSTVREAPVRKPVTVLIIDCIEPKSQMNRLNNSEATSHRDGYDEEVLHQYQVCYEV